LRCEIFPAELDAAVNFYTRVLDFTVTKDRRADARAYVSMRREDVQIGVGRRAVEDARDARRPPIGVEFVLEVDDAAPATPAPLTSAPHRPRAARPAATAAPTLA